MTKEESLKEINDTQDFYVSKLVDIILGNNASFDDLKEVDFTSPTGTGKTVMVAKLIKLLPQFFFVITTLSKGQLKYQVEKKIKQLCEECSNFIVYGSNDYSRGTILQEYDIIERLPKDKRIIWIRDEGHIATNRWQEVLRNRSSYIINFSATNKRNNGVQCNFAHTMMLRTVSQKSGSPKDALDKLLEIKKLHKKVLNYNPCALFRVLYDQHLDEIINECNKRGLKYINITDEEYDMSEICEDNNYYDVIINKFKITEGIDLKRCHVIYMDTKPGNDYTTIQVIGRARRNALFWRDDIDILDKANKELLEQTRKCFVFYNIPDSVVEQNDFGEFVYSICDTISVELLRQNIEIEVNNGQLANGLKVLELEGKTGKFKVIYDEEMKANIVDNPSFYKTKTEIYKNYTLCFSDDFSIKEIVFKKDIKEAFLHNLRTSPEPYDKLKQEFYVFKTIYKDKLSEELIDSMEKELHVRDKWHSISTTDYFFTVLRDYKTCIDEIRNNEGKYSNIYNSIEALEYAKLEDQYGYSLGARFIENGYIAEHFYKYIESIKYYDMSAAERITDFLELHTNVTQKSLNLYLYLPHPDSDYFRIRFHGADFKEIKKKILGLTQKSFKWCSVNYLKKMFEKVKSFEEIDKYDLKKMSLSELNDKFRIGLSDDDVIRYITNNYKLINGHTIRSFSKRIIQKTGVNGLPRIYKFSWIFYSEIINKPFQEYEAVLNDKELAVYGVDTMKYSNGVFVEDKNVTSKISTFSKFNTFIERKYGRELSNVRPYLFTGKNDFDFDRKCNSCLGFCVECYAKLKLFPKRYKHFIDNAQDQAHSNEVTNAVLVRASMLIYKFEMESCYGKANLKRLPTMSVEALSSDKYSSFVSKVIELGEKTASFVVEQLYGGYIDPKQKPYKPDLSTDHINALCDFITRDTILDIKCTSYINEKYVKQVLAYYYLSTKRSDLDIKRLIVFDAPTGKYVEIFLNESGGYSKSF